MSQSRVTIGFQFGSDGQVSGHAGLRDLSIFDQIVAKGRVTSIELAGADKADQTLVSTSQVGDTSRPADTLMYSGFG